MFNIKQCTYPHMLETFQYQGRLCPKVVVTKFWQFHAIFVATLPPPRGNNCSVYITLFQFSNHLVPRRGKMVTSAYVYSKKSMGTPLTTKRSPSKFFAKSRETRLLYPWSFSKYCNHLADLKTSSASGFCHSIETLLGSWWTSSPPMVTIYSALRCSPNANYRRSFSRSNSGSCRGKYV